MILMRRRPPDPMLRWLLPLAAAWAGPGWAQVDVRLSKIDEGVAWVSPYWGYNAPKLIFDGTAYYTLGLWGAEQATARGAIYKLENGQWRRGYTWDGLNYQPGLLLLDGQQRLILIYPTLNGPPVVLRAAEPGQIDRFEPLPAPPSGKAGYMGAGIRAERLVIAYIGDPATYTFQLAVLDLAAQTWDGPFVLAPAQRRDEPFTTWLYPIVQPDATGIHLLVSNQPDPTARYDRILYMHLPYAPAAPPQPEVIAQGAMAFGEAMLQTPDGRIYVTAQYQPDEEATNQLYIFQRDPQAQAWSGQALSPSQVAAPFYAPGEPTRLWIPSTYGAQLRLYTSEDAGASWSAVTLPNLEEYGLVSTFFMHGISAASGSLAPPVPTVVFSAGVHPNYELWFAQFAPDAHPTAVEVADAPASRGAALVANAPNPFNGHTAIRFSLDAPGPVELAVYNLKGQRVTVLAQGARSAGWHTVTWSGRGRATGVYLCRLHTANATLTRKLVLIR